MSLRLDRERTHLLCGVRDCGARIARIHGETGLGGPQHICLKPGYRRQPDDTFQMTAHAQARIRRGLPPRPQGRAFGPEHDPVSPGLAGVVPCCLPVRVRCWRCSTLHVLHEGEVPAEAGPGHSADEPHQDRAEAWLPKLITRAAED